MAHDTTDEPDTSIEKARNVHGTCELVLSGKAAEAATTEQAVDGQLRTTFSPGPLMPSPASSASSLFGLRDEQHMREMAADKIADLDNLFDGGFASTSALAATESTASNSSPVLLSSSMTLSNIESGMSVLSLGSETVSSIKSSRRHSGTQTDFDVGLTDGTCNLDQFVNPSNAQSYLLPHACLFAANLPVAWSDNSIQAALHIEFSKFGPVYIKVKRDQTQLPVAFVQYASILDAREALKLGKKIVIGGRIVRIELARCERTLFCCRNVDEFAEYPDITDEEVEDIRFYVSRYDEVESVTRVSEEDRQFYRFLPGVWIKFRFYGACQDTFRLLVRMSTGPWRFELLRDRSQRYDTFAHSKKLNRRSRVLPGNEDISAQPKFRGCGSIILIEGLPVTVTTEQVVALCQQFGTIYNVEMTPGFKMDKERGFHSRSAYLGFAQKYAGPAACAAAERFGMAAQDAARLVWSGLTVRMLPVRPSGRDRSMTPAASFDMSHFGDYVSSLPHPALVAATSPSKPGTPVLWTPHANHNRWLNTEQVMASSPLLASPASTMHMEAYHFPIDGYADPVTGLYAPFGPRGGHYAAVQGRDWWPEDASASSPCSTVSYSGMSPAR